MLPRHTRTIPAAREARGVDRDVGAGRVMWETS